MLFINVIRKRLLFLLAVVLGVSLITFSISHLIPGDPARLVAGERASEEVVQNIRIQMGLDRPLPEQYWKYLNATIHGDLGTSLRTNRPVAEDLKIFFPATLELALIALLLAVLVGAPLGVLSAVYRDRPIDHVVRTMAVTGISTPAFWLGLLLIMTFYGDLGWLPSGGRIGTELTPPARVTGLYLIDSAIAGDWPAFASSFKHLILPAFTLSFVHLGVVARQIRSAMLEELQQDYVRTARANGIAKWQVIVRHALPNALIPSVTVLGLALGDLLYGAVLTETVFAWPGMGAYVVNSIQSLDFPAVMGFAVVVSFAYVLVNLFVDLIYMLIDPRIQEVN
ncbi:putative D,D-dipeptide transport system permease protein DdpB [Curvibacter sp. AEP1-3]|uniref:ABC transporter permease n=1 Tax=Curvibacter sp. AEP1-3 TaxID=1844971 RepID=UPI000B3C261B|nr:ABC transporter permease [Curvibacter sp. AEP1-3]ARV17598.1 putative D,D-dipeptide transport system permease protein DdpB [Curvibacter sp. AEP1-3]